jgi:hypothetical protein
MLLAVACCGILLVAVLKAISVDQRVQRRVSIVRARAVPIARRTACPGAIFRTAYYERRAARLLTQHGEQSRDATNPL